MEKNGNKLHLEIYNDSKGNIRLRRMEGFKTDFIYHAVFPDFDECKFHADKIKGDMKIFRVYPDHTVLLK